MYLLAHVAFRLRNVHTLNHRRLLCAPTLFALAPLVASLSPPPPATLAVLVALWRIDRHEAVRFADARERVRNQGTLSEAVAD